MYEHFYSKIACDIFAGSIAPVSKEDIWKGVWIFEKGYLKRCLNIWKIIFKKMWKEEGIGCIIHTDVEFRFLLNSALFEGGYNLRFTQQPKGCECNQLPFQFSRKRNFIFLSVFVLYQTGIFPWAVWEVHAPRHNGGPVNESLVLRKGF